MSNDKFQVNIDTIVRVSKSNIVSFTANDLQTVVEFMNYVSTNAAAEEMLHELLKCNMKCEYFKSWMILVKCHGQSISMQMLNQYGKDELTRPFRIVKFLMSLDEKTLELFYRFKSVCDEYENKYENKYENNSLNEIMNIISSTNDAFRLWDYSRLYKFDNEYVSTFVKGTFQLSVFQSWSTYAERYENVWSKCNLIKNNFAECLDDENKLIYLPVSATRCVSSTGHITITSEQFSSTFVICPNNLLNVYHPIFIDKLNDDVVRKLAPKKRSTAYIDMITNNSKVVYTALNIIFGKESNWMIEASLPKLIYSSLPFVNCLYTLLISEYFDYVMSIIHKHSNPEILGLIAEYIVLLLFGNTSDNETRIRECENRLKRHKPFIKPFEYKHLLPKYGTTYISNSGDSYRCDGRFDYESNKTKSYIEIKNVKELTKHDLIKWMVDVVTNKCRHGFMISFSQYLPPILTFSVKTFGIFNSTNLDPIISYFIQIMDVPQPDEALELIVNEYEKNREDECLNTVLKECKDLICEEKTPTRLKVIMPGTNKSKDINIERSFPYCNNTHQIIGFYNVPEDNIFKHCQEYIDFYDSPDKYRLHIAFKQVDKSVLNNGFDPDRKIFLTICHETNVLPQLTHYRDIFILRTDANLITLDFAYIILTTFWPSMVEWIANVMYSEFDNMNPSDSDESMPDRYEYTKQIVKVMKNRFETLVQTYNPSI